MDENNVFNSFSFKKWAKFVREQRMEEEIRRQRMEQVIRLRNKLIRERALRDQVDLLTDEDVDKLVHYMSTAGKSFAGIATGIQSTFRFGRRHPAAAAGSQRPLPSISGTIGPGAGQKPGTSRPPAVEEEPTPPPTELSGRLPPEEPRDSNYMFGEIPILAPLHPHGVPGRRRGWAEEDVQGVGQQKPGFQHNVRFGATPTKVAGSGGNGGGGAGPKRQNRGIFQWRTKK